MVSEPQGTVDNPFLEGRQYRADDIGEVMGQRNWWRVMALGLAGVVCLAVLGLIYLGTQPKWVPVLIRWDSSTGETSPVGVHPRAGEEPVTLRLWLQEFVTALRGISTDIEVNRIHWNTAMQRVTDEAKPRLLEYETKQQPLEQKNPVSIEILHKLRITGQTWQVRWEETTYSRATGELVSRQRMVGTFTYRQATPRTLKQITYNPVGIFFHEWSWSPE